MAAARASIRRATDLGVTRSQRMYLPVETVVTVPDPAIRGDRASLGRADASPKYSLATQVNRLLDEQRMSQTAAAERLGIPQSKVSAIRNYKLHGISLERLLQALVALDQRVAIMVGPRGAPVASSISVVI